MDYAYLRARFVDRLCHCDGDIGRFPLFPAFPSSPFLIAHFHPRDPPPARVFFPISPLFPLACFQFSSRSRGSRSRRNNHRVPILTEEISPAANRGSKENGTVENGIDRENDRDISREPVRGSSEVLRFFPKQITASPRAKSL